MLDLGSTELAEVNRPHSPPLSDLRWKFGEGSVSRRFAGGRTMGGCEGRLSVVAAVADMKGKTWGRPK